MGTAALRGGAGAWASCVLAEPGTCSSLWGVMCSGASSCVCCSKCTEGSMVGGAVQCSFTKPGHCAQGMLGAATPPGLPCAELAAPLARASWPQVRHSNGSHVQSSANLAMKGARMTGCICGDSAECRPWHRLRRPDPPFTGLPLGKPATCSKPRHNGSLGGTKPLPFH